MPVHSVLAGYVILVAVSTTFVPGIFPQMRRLHVALCYAMAPLLAFCNSYASGLTDWSLGTIYAKLAIFVFGAWVGKAAGGEVAGLAACGVLLVVTGNASELVITFALAYSPSVLLFSSPFCSIANTSVPHPTSPSASSINDDDSGYNSAMESAAMVTSSSPTSGVIKMDDGEIPELTDFFKKTIVTEADRQAYHDLGWLLVI
jgi:hypothetical protein